MSGPGRHYGPFNGLPRNNGPTKLFSAFEAAPRTAHLRWIALLVLGLSIAVVATLFGVFMARDNRAIGRVSDDIDTARDDLAFLTAFAANLTLPPTCQLINNGSATSNFSDAAFSVFSAGDPSAELVFDLGTLDPSSLVILTIQDFSGTVAYLSDIPAISSVFQDDEFTVFDDVVTDRRVMLNLFGVSGSTTQIMNIQNATGTIAYLSDLPSGTSVFLDNAFAVQYNLDATAQVMLDVSLVTPSFSRVMTVQNASGIIAYLSDISSGAGIFLDSVFGVFDDLDPSKLMELNCSFIAGSTLQTMTVQNANGTIAYLTDIPQTIEVFLNTSRSFPDITNEGVSSLAGLGSLELIEISLCGGGGGGGANTDGGPGGGGGSGSGHENFAIPDPTTKFIAFNCTIGLGGTGSLPIFATWGQSGNTTSVIGFSSTDHFLELFGYGGGGGHVGATFGNGGSPGGAGGGGGGGAVNDVPGIDGIEGGLIGGLGGTDAPFVNHTNAVRGGINLSWRSGGGGGGGRTDSVPAAWQGGFGFDATECSDIFTGCGAASMFGIGGNKNTDPNGGYCAGGGNDDSGPNGADGGDGAVLFRYLIL